MGFKINLRSTLVVAALAASTAAHADLTVPFAGLVGNSVQAFSDRANKAFTLQSVTVSALGNGTAVAGATLPAFNFPITSITVGSKLNIVSGAASGSALKLSRTLDDGSEAFVVLANFTIDYNAKQVLADTTITGGAVVKQHAIYNFNIATPLALKYKFPLTITGHEVLDKLFLTEEAKDNMMAGLVLDDYIRAGVLDTTDFGTLTQDITVKTRAKAVPTAPYVVK
jgi:hypothetical protein